MAKVRSHESIRRWKGTSAQIADVARAAKKLAPPVDDELERRASRPSVRVAYAYATDEFDSAEEFERSVLPADLDRLTSISVESGPITGTWARIQFSRRPGESVEVVVEGSDRTAVEGIREKLTGELRQGERRPARWLGLEVAVTLTFLAAGPSIAGAMGFLAGDSPVPTLSVVFLGIALLCLFLAGVVAIGGWLVPQLELLTPGTRTRWQRWRCAVAALVLLLVGVLVFVLVNQL